MMNNEKEKDAIDTSKLDEILPKYDPLKLNSINLAQNYVSAFNTGMNIYQCVNQLQGYIEWVVKAVNDVVKSWNVQVGESIDQSKAIVRETTTEQFNTEWTNKQPELIEQVNTLTTNQFNEDWGVLENRINTTLETQNTNIQNIQNEQNELETNTNNNINAQNTKINSIQTQQTTLSNRMDTFTRLSEGSTTGDAELQDIRLGANGVTYNNAGDAVRGQYSQLKEDLVTEKNSSLGTNMFVILNDKMTFENGLINTVNGNKEISNDYECSDFITVFSGKKYFIDRGYSYVCLYDGQKNYIKYETYASFASEEIVFDENIKFARLTRAKNDVDYIFGYYNFNNYDIFDVMNGELIYDTLYHKNIAIFNDGNAHELVGYSATPYLPIKDNVILRLTNGFSVTNFYDEKFKLIESKTYASQISVPANSKYFRTCKDDSYENQKIKVTALEIERDTNEYIATTATGLRAIVAEAIQHKNSKVYVKSGTYDLLKEFESEINADSNNPYGIALSNSVHIIFESGCKVTALYQGQSSNVANYFSPFYITGNGGFTLENLDIESSNCRYCVHDEGGFVSDYYTNKYINCKMVHDDTNCVTKNYPQCIGGGLGTHGYIYITNCYFESKRAENIADEIVSYHNQGMNENSQSNVYMSNCYLAGKGTFKASHYGPSAKLSYAYLNNNSLGSPIINRHETSDTSTPENFKVVEYLNEVRS